MASDSVFLQIQFVLLVVVSLLLPSVVFLLVLRQPRFARAHVMFLGFALLILAGLDVILLQKLQAIAILSTDLMDDIIFASGYSLALYILPLAAAALGTDLLSYAVISRLNSVDADERKKN